MPAHKGGRNREVGPSIPKDDGSGWSVMDYVKWRRLPITDCGSPWYDCPYASCGNHEGNRVENVMTTEGSRSIVTCAQCGKKCRPRES